MSSSPPPPPLLLTCDSLVTSYLLYRGYTSTHTSFLSESKHSPDITNPSKIVDGLFAAMEGENFWTLYLRVKELFDAKWSQWEIHLAKCWLVTKIKCNSHTEIHDFLSSPPITLPSSFRPWYSIVYVRTPEKDAAFSSYFMGSFRENLKIGVFNFLNSVVKGVELPRILFLLKYMGSDEQRAVRSEIEGLRGKSNALEEENEGLKRRVKELEGHVEGLVDAVVGEIEDDNKKLWRDDVKRGEMVKRAVASRGNVEEFLRILRSEEEEEGGGAL
mmetsp:Transcript_19424/g.36117  ORF Transcript_19424/g.36117 Transcript_19424/m.36117 type:complete len:273 (-) Transcript_19424:31-849(-)